MSTNAALDALERSRSRRLRSQADALSELKELQDRVEQAAHRRKSRQGTSTAAAKWEFARKVAEDAPCIEAWGSGNRHVNGAYTYSAEKTGSGPVVYQSSVERDSWLYVSAKGHWLLGGQKSMESRDPAPREKPYLRSAGPAQPGVLPHMINEWQVLAGSDYRTVQTTKFLLRETVQVKWQELRVAACECPVIRVSGINVDHADGLFDYVPGEGRRGEPPVFQHQRKKDLWLYLATDQRWWVSYTEEKHRRAPVGVAKTTDPVEPGQMPGDAAGGLSVYDRSWQRRAVEVGAEPDELRACDKWAEAKHDAPSIEFWGSVTERGTFILDRTQDAMELPVYNFEKDPSVVLFMSTDGHWRMGTRGVDGKTLRAGHLRSAEPVEPGTLPEVVEAWHEKQAKEWIPNPKLRFHTCEGVVEAWRKAHAKLARQQILRMEGSLNFDGLYDYVSGASREDEAPSFINQIDQDRWLYLGDDGCWWIGTQDQMSRRKQKGKLQSRPVQPGSLPTEARKWRAWDSSAKEWTVQSSLKVFLAE